jgi:ABC-type Fe3+-hydroxamate transport system substrate-binding protein
MTIAVTIRIDSADWPDAMRLVAAVLDQREEACR